jgi:hypothetical protein
MRAAGGGAVERSRGSPRASSRTHPSTVVPPRPTHQSDRFTKQRPTPLHTHDAPPTPLHTRAALQTVRRAAAGCRHAPPTANQPTNASSNPTRMGCCDVNQPSSAQRQPEADESGRRHATRRQHLTDRMQHPPCAPTSHRRSRPERPCPVRLAVQRAECNERASDDRRRTQNRGSEKPTSWSEVRAIRSPHPCTCSVPPPNLGGGELPVRCISPKCITDNHHGYTPPQLCGGSATRPTTRSFQRGSPCVRAGTQHATLSPTPSQDGAHASPP